LPSGAIGSEAGAATGWDALGCSPLAPAGLFFPAGDFLGSVLIRAGVELEIRPQKRGEDSGERAIDRERVIGPCQVRRDRWTVPSPAGGLGAAVCSLDAAGKAETCEVVRITGSI